MLHYSIRFKCLIVTKLSKQRSTIQLQTIMVLLLQQTDNQADTSLTKEFICKSFIHCIKMVERNDIT